MTDAEREKFYRDKTYLGHRRGRIPLWNTGDCALCHNYWPCQVVCKMHPLPQTGEPS